MNQQPAGRVILKLAIVGGGRACKFFLELISLGNLPYLQIDIIGVCDINPEAEGFRMAQQLGIYTTTDFKDLFVLKDLDGIIELTNSRDVLAEHFLKKFCHETTKRVDRISPHAYRILAVYDWPGNVRELENAIERAAVLSKSRILNESDFAFLRPPPTTAPPGPSLREMEKYHICRILDQHGWNVTQAAKALEINRVTLHKKIKRYQLEPDGAAKR